ncbi:MAG: hypothetical protein IT159_11680 [Bryobacterales bacterium]|nr:hypothetical protein [Bryobacterales bacterium]
MTLGHLEALIAFAAVMLGVSLVVTILNQMTAAFLGLRGTNLLWGLKTLLGTLDEDLKLHAEGVAREVLTHPLVSDSTLSRFSGRLTRRWRLASAVRLEEFLSVLNVVAPQLDRPAAAAAAPLLGDSVPGGIPNPRERLEARFQTAMDRVSQRFAMHMRVWTVAFSILVAFAAHLDAFRLLTELSSKPELRARIASSAEAVANRANELLGPEGLASSSNAAAFRVEVSALSAKAGELREELGRSGLRLVPDPYPGWPDFPGWPRNLHFWGILVTAALLSLGAPFWFHALKTLSNLRPALADKTADGREKNVPGE